MFEQNRLAALRAENARLIELLEAHGIEWRLPPEPHRLQSAEYPSSTLSTSEKVALFRCLLRGRDDVYPVRWESKKTGKSGYTPACGNEWRPGVCEKPQVKCSECGSRQLLPLTDSVIYSHLAGAHTVGVYPLLPDDTCHFLAVDFDDADWRDDAVAFVQSCHELEVAVALEISRSGEGAHAWVFFAQPVAARNARRLGSAIISHIEKSELPQPLANRLIRLAAFQNPEFYKAQAMRFPVWDKPRVIGCAENYPNHIALPRGCFEAALDLLGQNRIRCDLRDERVDGQVLDVDFVGTLRPDQESAVAEIISHKTGVLCAPTAFGKTVVAAAIIARRGVNTLVLVHRTELLEQWQERLQAFLGVDMVIVGTIRGGKVKPTGKIDIALMQSVSRKGEVNSLVEDYGQVIVDECHHIGAASFEAILKRVKAEYVLGLTATPVRRDGQQPIIFMQCGPIRYTATSPASAPNDLEVRVRECRNAIDLSAEVGIQEVFRHLANDEDRTADLAIEIIEAYQKGRKTLVLTERTDHLHKILVAVEGQLPSVFVLHGRMSKKQRASMLADLNALPPNAPRVLLATGKLVGEGFDHPPLDTMVLAMPISWKGTLQQYAGRLHREHKAKSDVRIIDFVDIDHPALMRMWKKRRRGYRAMGYRITVSDVTGDEDIPLFSTSP